MEAMRAQFERDADLDTPWSSYNPSLARPLLNTKKFLEKGLAGSRPEDARPQPETAAAAAAADGSTGPGKVELTGVPRTLTSANPSPESPPQPGTPPGDSQSPLEALQRKFAAHKVTAGDHN